MKSKVIMGALLLLIGVSGAVVTFGNDQYNKELHTLEFDGSGSDANISASVAPRGADTGEIASWYYDAEFEDKDGNIYNRDTTGVIYELSITNNTANVVNDWEYEVHMSEDIYFNGGWNGVFDIHQNVNSDDPKNFATQDFNMSSSGLEYTNRHECLLVNMYKDDYFVYTPSPKSLEVPIESSDIKNDQPTVKTIGFILYTERNDRDYSTTFQRSVIRYHMHRSLFKNKAFIAVIIAFTLWILGVIEMLILNIQNKKFAKQRDRDMKIIEEAMSTFANFIDAKDPNTKGHSVRVANYSRMIARKLGMKEEECTDIYYIGLLHDCGKISIPQEILTKPAKLTDDEYATMKSHSAKGHEMLKDFTSIPNIVLGAYCHHERYDGKGYPQGIKGEDIPLIGRIICIADAFDAMNSKRCYRDKLPREVIIGELEKNKGKQFDPKITDIFLELIEKGDIKI